MSNKNIVQDLNIPTNNLEPQQVIKNEGETFETMLSTTYKIRCGCGNLYVIIIYDDKRRFKRLFIPRNSKFNCDLVMRDGLARIGTFEGKRSLRQAIRDLGGSKANHCDKYNVTCEATSCSDAVAISLKKWQKQKRKRRKDNLNDN